MTFNRFSAKKASQTKYSSHELGYAQDYWLAKMNPIERGEVIHAVQDAGRWYTGIRGLRECHAYLLDTMREAVEAHHAAEMEAMKEILGDKFETVYEEEATPPATPTAASEAATVASEPEAAPSDSKPETPFTTRYGSPVELLGWYEQDVLVNVRYADGEENEAYISDLRAPNGLSQIMDYLNNKSVVRYLVANNFIDCDLMEFDSRRDILEHLKECESDGESMAGYQVMVMRGNDMIESLRADNWLYGYDSDPVIAAYEHAGSNPLIAQMLLIDSDPIADYDAQVIAERAEEVKARLELPYQTADLVSFADAFNALTPDSTVARDAAFAEAIAAVSGDDEYYDSLLAPQPVSIWTHKLPVAENVPRYQKTRKTARKREIPRLVVQLANMQRMHPANRVIRKNTRPVVNIADVLRQLGIVKAA